MNPRGEQQKEIINPASLDEALKYARQDLEKYWEFYKSQFLKQLKND